MDVSTVSISKIQSELQLIKAQLAELLTAKPEAWLTTQQVCERYHLS